MSRKFWAIWINGFGFGMACMAFLSMAHDAAFGADHIPPTNGRTLQVCASEDGSYGHLPCAWLAVDVDSMPAVGNGTGESFRIYRDGRIKTITDRRAYQLLNGMPNHD